MQLLKKTPCWPLASTRMSAPSHWKWFRFKPSLHPKGTRGDWMSKALKQHSLFHQHSKQKNINIPLSIDEAHATKWDQIRAISHRLHCDWEPRAKGLVVFHSKQQPNLLSSKKRRCHKVIILCHLIPLIVYLTSRWNSCWWQNLKFGILSKPTEVGVQVSVQNLGDLGMSLLSSKPTQAPGWDHPSKTKKYRARCGGMRL